MKFILYLFTYITRVMIFITKLFGGGGTALPGLWIERYFPFIIREYSSCYDEIVLITGTNGKTTTQLLLKHILSKSGLEVVGNASGSNMFRGIAATLVSKGMMSKSRENRRVLILEVEEGTMPKIAPYLQATRVIVTNFFRDQLDAYGEIYKTVEYINSALKYWPKAHLYINADDPKVSKAVSDLPNRMKSFSLSGGSSDFLYEQEDASTNKRQIDLTTKSFDLEDDFRSNICLRMKEIGTNSYKEFEIRSALLGSYNIYNLMGVLLVVTDLGITIDQFQKYLNDFKSPFGRGEIVKLNEANKGVSFRIFLVKNPAGISQVWKMVRQKINTSIFMIALNDNVADGRDVSWIWDFKPEKLSGEDMSSNMLITGTRAYDMAIRMQYAGFFIKKENVYPDLSECLEKCIAKSKNTQNKEVIVLSTYTAMNDIRSKLSKYTTIEKFA
ncbi:MAG: MurT ligase domain-containing protein [Patescibacteria group bacterium]